jgi:hypothetical protein
MRLCLIFLLFLIPFTILGQRKKLPGPPTEAEYLLAEKHNQCFNTNKYSAKQRASFFPFKEASIVKLISFPFDMEDSVHILDPVAVNHFTVNYDKVIENRVLSKKGIDSLTDILYNIRKTPDGKLPLEIFGEIKCYEPRNAILFINSQGVVTQYIELCFGCQKYFFSSKKIRPMEYCEQKYEMLKQLFLKQGIQYGTILPKRD